MATQSENLNIADYAKYYQEGDRLTWLIFAGLVVPQAIPEFCAEIEHAQPQEITQLLDEFLSECHELDFDVSGLLSMTPEQQEDARREFEALTPDEQQAAILQAQAFWLMFMVYFFEILSIVVHASG